MAVTSLGLSGSAAQETTSAKRGLYPEPPATDQAKPAPSKSNTAIFVIGVMMIGVSIVLTSTHSWHLLNPMNWHMLKF
jgi:hypothetical protein